MRGLVLTKSMLNLLRSDEVDIFLRLEANASAEPDVFTKRGKPERALYSARANDFMDVVAKVVNNSGLSLSIPHSFSRTDNFV